MELCPLFLLCSCFLCIYVEVLASVPIIFLVLFDFVYWLNEKLVDCSYFLIIISSYFIV